MAQKGEAIHARHPHVGNQHIYCRLLKLLQRFFAVPCKQDVVAVLQVQSQNPASGFFVIGDEDCRFTLCHGLSPLEA